MNVLGEYANGNYSVKIFDDGTKIRENDLDFFKADFPENIDLKITDYCDAGCLYCHENSTKKGLHGNLSLSFLETLRPHTELAIGGGNPLDHPDLEEFLYTLKEKNIIANLTVNQIHFERNQSFIVSLVEKNLVYGLGVSMIKATDKFVSLVSQYPNAIIHTINGILTNDNLERLFDKNLKILILGYKYLRRGVDYYSDIIEKNKKFLYGVLPDILDKFDVVSFDNLALEQLNVKRLVTNKYWEQFYMGNDGDFTMYIDMVKEEFSKSSTCTTRYPITKDIKSMFGVARNIE